MILFLFSQIRWTWQYICRFGTRYSTGQCCQCICSVTIASITYSSIECTADSPFLFLVSSTASVVSSTISSIDVLGEDLTNHRFGRLYRRWLKCANRTMKQNLRQVREKKPHRIQAFILIESLQPGRRHRRCIGIAFIVTFPPNDMSKYRYQSSFSLILLCFLHHRFVDISKNSSVPMHH